MAEVTAVSATTMHEMAAYCKHFQDIISSLSRHASGDINSMLIYQEKCTSICKHIDDNNSEIMTEATLHKYLQAIAQLVLDVTFLEEKSLIDEDFSNKSSFCRVWNVIDALQSVEDLAYRIVQDKSVVDALSSEITECLQWRKGALLYMYCHTINAQFSFENLPFNFRQCLEEGIKYLTSMFCTRSPPKWLTGIISNRMESDSEQEADGEASSTLLTQGILSDTHLLALMYCGELCYWHTKLRRLPDKYEHVMEPVSGEIARGAVDLSAHSVEINVLKYCSKINTTPDACDSIFASEHLKPCSSSSVCSSSEKNSTSTSNVAASNSETKIDIEQIGKLCLENYISAAHGPLVVGGWKTRRAEEILQYFYSQK
ncbi:hypothetical protein BsWGS_02179 [Bradybaena similaris]